MSKFKFSLTQHDNQIVGPRDLDGSLKIKAHQFAFFVLWIQRRTLQPWVQSFWVSGDGRICLSQHFFEVIVSGSQGDDRMKTINARVAKGEAMLRSCHGKCAIKTPALGGGLMVHSSGG